MRKTKDKSSFHFFLQKKGFERTEVDQKVQKNRE